MAATADPASRAHRRDDRRQRGAPRPYPGGAPARLGQHDLHAADPALGEARLAEAQVQPPQPLEALVVAEPPGSRRCAPSTFARQRRSVSA